MEIIGYIYKASDRTAGGVEGRVVGDAGRLDYVNALLDSC